MGRLNLISFEHLLIKLCIFNKYEALDEDIILYMFVGMLDCHSNCNIDRFILTSNLPFSANETVRQRNARRKAETLSRKASLHAPLKLHGFLSKKQRKSASAGSLLKS